MRVFITGSTGYIGANLVKALFGHNLCLYKRGEDIIEKVTDFKPEVIYHLAAELHNENKMWVSNVELTERLVAASVKVPFQSFVYLGSSSEYGIQEGPMAETMACRPKTFYGETKLLGTASCLHLAVSLLGKKVEILRPFSVYGTGQREDSFFPTAVKCCLKGKTFELWEGNHDWVHVHDVVKALLYFGSQGKAEGIVNIGTGVQTSNADCIKLIEKIVNKKMKINKHKGMKNKMDSKVWVADISKARELGWEAKITLEEGLRKQIDDIRKKG